MTLLERHYDQLGITLREVWNLYMKFYVIFMTVNFTALGLTVEYIDLQQRAPMVIAFLVQNFLGLVSAISIAIYSKKAAAQQDAIIDLLRKEESLPDDENSVALSTVIPVQFAFWGGVANALSHTLFGVCWLGALFWWAPLLAT